jgi:hypothetical protein
MLNKVKNQLIAYGVPSDEIDAIWDEAVEVADATARIVPDIGFLSTDKRLNAYLVTTGRMSEMPVSPDVLELATTILIETHKGFRKGYQAFIYNAERDRINIGMLNPVAIKAIEGMRSVRGY